MACLILALLVLPLTARVTADVSCPPILTDNMVVQRDKPVTIWGNANAGETVTVSIASQTVSTTTDAAGHWSVSLDPLSTSFKSQALTVHGENTLTFKNVLVGEVWLCSGQSNMVKPLGETPKQLPTDEYPQILQKANIPLLRLYTVPGYGKVTDEENQFQWKPSTAESVEQMKFSAACFYFGKELASRLKVPVGLIHSSFGGTMIETWLPEEAFQKSPTLQKLRHREYFAWVEGVQATELYESMISPLIPFALAGVIWYQGESNLIDGDNASYVLKQKTLIETWRDNWHDRELPFYIAQLTPFTYSKLNRDKLLTVDALPIFWEAQINSVNAIENSGIIPTLDLAPDVSDIHPVNKRDIGKRFALMALEKRYGQAVEGDAPRFSQVLSTSDDTITFEVANAPDGLSPQGELRETTFQIAGEDGHYHRAIAKVSGHRVSLYSEEVHAPKTIRYAWSEVAQGDVFNKSGLPMLPFRTDQQPLETIRPRPAAPSEN